MRSSCLSLLILCSLSWTVWSQTEYEGVGLLIGLKEQQWVVQAVLPGSPADSADILPGDSIVAFKGSKGDRYFDLRPDTMGAMASEFHRPGSRPLGLRLQRGGRTLEVEVQRGRFLLTEGALRGLPEGRVTGIERGWAQAEFPRETLAYGDRLAVLRGHEVVGLAEVREAQGSSYRLNLMNLPRNQPPPATPGPGGLPQSGNDSESPWQGVRVVLLEHSDRYYENASGGRTASGRLDRPYVSVSPALDSYERQVAQGTLCKQSATIRDFNPSQKTFLMRWQKGQMVQSGVSGSHIRTNSTFSTGDPLYELTILYQGAPVWYSADAADQGKDASSRLREGQEVRVYYRPFGVDGSGMHRGRRTQTRQGQAVLILLGP